MSSLYSYPMHQTDQLYSILNSIGRSCGGLIFLKTIVALQKNKRINKMYFFFSFLKCTPKPLFLQSGSFFLQMSNIFTSTICLARSSTELPPLTPATTNTENCHHHQAYTPALHHGTCFFF